MKKLFIIALLMNVLHVFGYSISNNGKEFIKNQENCVLTAYWDSNGYSIGWGHHGSDVKKNMRISKAQANKYFNKDIKVIEAAANRLLKNLPYKYNFSQGFFDGLCSLVYNAGEGGVMKSEFYKRLKNCRVRNGKINQNDLNFSIAGVKTSRISCKAHVSRRYDEHKLMLS
jgi:GH24 family phage-related lysozyme (muramidase)